MRKAQINVVSVVLLRHQPENVKGKRKTEQTPVGTFGTAKESSRGPTCYSLKRPSATSALCYADVNVDGGGEGPPVLGKTPELHRISRCFFLFSKLPIPHRSEGERGKRAKWPEDTRKPTCLSVFFQFGDQISVSVTIKGIRYHQSGFPDARDKARRPLAVPVAAGEGWAEGSRP